MNAYRGAGKFPLRAYSEFMPPPYIAIKPYAPTLASACATFTAGHGDQLHGMESGGRAPTLGIDEYEQAHDLEPGFGRIGARIVAELGKLVRGQPHALSKTLLEGNPAWPAELAAAAKAGALADDPLVVIAALALSRTQDDKGNERWTLFGTSHDGPARAMWHGCDAPKLAEIMTWAGVTGAWKILGDDVPPALHAHLLGTTPIGEVRALVTFTPFARLPRPVRDAYLARKLTLIPTPATLVFFEHPKYRELATVLPRATQIPLLHVFPRVERSCAIRIPQSGWLDEHDPAQQQHGHRIVGDIARTHRWQRVDRDSDVIHGDGAYTDKVSTALFSTEPDDLGLYDKPLARNVEIWTGDYRLLLDGPHAGRTALKRAAGIVDAGGRFGYRMAYPPMRAGVRELFWHAPIVAKPDGRFADAPRGYVTAEAPNHEPLLLEPKLLARPVHRAVATLFESEPGRARHTTAHNARKLLEMHQLLGGKLDPEHARSLVHCAKTDSLETWLAAIPARASDRTAGGWLADELSACIGAAQDAGEVRVIDKLGTRAFEEQIWTSIASLAHGDFKQKDNADGIRTNAGKHGGPAAKAAHVVAHERRDLEALGDHLHARYRKLIEAAGMQGKAEVVDHVFRWESDFDFPWMEGWEKNQQGPKERNIVMMIPGRNRGEAIVMGDHYDTAYMEDVYDADQGGDQLRAAACGADDNHSATTALLLAAEQLLPLARAGKLERDVWLIHLTGEEFPSDCMGARALGQGLVERSLAFTAEDGSIRDVAKVQVVGAFVLDMIGHNSDRDRDVFQIAPGEGACSARLALRAHRANRRWNALAQTWNADATRGKAGRAKRMPDRTMPPPFAHLPLFGEIRVEWEPRSALYNTDGQIFSDLGIPVVLFMENYDISRKGYHDTHDTMENIDLDYCAALTAIAIETVVDCACSEAP